MAEGSSQRKAIKAVVTGKRRHNSMQPWQEFYPGKEAYWSGSSIMAKRGRGWQRQSQQEARGSRQEELRRRGEEVLQQESEAVVVRLWNEARTLQGVGDERVVTRSSMD
jgi:hypothetical protein